MLKSSMSRHSSCRRALRSMHCMSLHDIPGSKHGESPDMESELARKELAEKSPDDLSFYVEAALKLTRRGHLGIKRLVKSCTWIGAPWYFVVFFLRCYVLSVLP